MEILGIEIPDWQAKKLAQMEFFPGLTLERYQRLKVESLNRESATSAPPLSKEDMGSIRCSSGPAMLRANESSSPKSCAILATPSVSNPPPQKLSRKTRKRRRN